MNRIQEVVERVQAAAFSQPWADEVGPLPVGITKGGWGFALSLNL